MSKINCCSCLVTATNCNKFCHYLLGDVYIQPTQDTKNPVIYGVFSVSGWVKQLQRGHGGGVGIFWVLPKVFTPFHSAWGCLLSLMLQCYTACHMISLQRQDRACVWSPEGDAALRGTDRACTFTRTVRLITGCHSPGNIRHAKLRSCWHTIRKRCAQSHNKLVLMNVFEEKILLFSSSA